MEEKTKINGVSLWTKTHVKFNILNVQEIGFKYHKVSSKSPMNDAGMSQSVRGDAHHPAVLSIIRHSVSIILKVFTLCAFQ